MTKNKKQSGGIFIKNNENEAFIDFMENSWFEYISKGSYGLTIKATLYDNYLSKYSFINPEYFFNDNNVKTLIIKFGFINTNYPDTEIQINNFEMSTVDLATFKNEVKIQTNIFLSTMHYLEPICPAIVYSKIYNERNGIYHLLKIIYYNSKGILKNIIYDINKLIKLKKINHIGIIGMEFATNYTLLYYLLKNPLINRINKLFYINMTLYLLLELAIKTGYSHGDFHPGNIFIDINYTNYFKGIKGKPLIIDFGLSTKIPMNILNIIKIKYNTQKYTEALKLLCQIHRSNGLSITNFPEYYGFVCGTYDYINQKYVKQYSSNTNFEIDKFVQKRKELIYNLKLLFKELHYEEPYKFPLIPLNNRVRNKVYSGIIYSG